jgi:hypothetical protein
MPKSLWISSEEKKTLRKDILSGVVSEETNIRDVYHMHDGAYLKYPYARFKVNCKNLIAAVRRSQSAAIEDEHALRNVLVDWPQPPFAQAAPAWHESVANALLLEDISSGVIEGLDPKTVWQRRPEYMQYTLQTFRDHLYKEKTKPTIKAYWEHQKELRKAKKAKKAKKAALQQYCSRCAHG